MGIGNSFVFKQIDNKQGLSQNGVVSIFQDEKGFMWIGSRYGLNQYDGFNILNSVGIGSKDELAENTIQFFLQDEAKNLWIATNQGLTIYDQQKNRLYNLNNSLPNKLTSHTILSMKLIDGKILISNSYGIWSINPRDIILGEKSTIDIKCWQLEIPTTIKSPIIYEKNSDGNICLTTDSRIIFAKIEGKELKIVDQIRIDDGNSVEITTIYRDEFSDIWVGTSENGLFLIKKNRGVYSIKKVYPQPNDTHSFLRITGIIQDDNKNLWVTSRSNGVIIISKDQLLSERITPYKLNQNELPTQNIKTIYKSRDNTIWLGSLGSGFFFCNATGNKFRTYRLSENPRNNSVNYVRSIINDSYDRLWFGTLFNGVHIYNKGNQVIGRQLLNNASIFDLMKIDANHIMAGTSAGLYIITYNASTFKAEPLISAGQARAPIFSICKKLDKFWVGSGNQVISFTLTDNLQASDIRYYQNKELFNSENENNIRIIRYSALGNRLWIGSESSGLVTASLNSRDEIVNFSPIRDSNSESNILGNYICDLDFDTDSICWVATHSGLIRLGLSSDGAIKSKRRFTTNDGLPSNLIQSVISHNGGDLWVGSIKGLTKFNTQTFSCVNYDITDGIQDYEFAEHASYIDGNGNIYFGGVNGVSEISSQQMSANTFVDKIHITDILVNGERSFNQSPDSERLVLSHSENNLRFSFIVYNYVNPLKCKYAYMLEGHDQQWRYTTGVNRTAEYSNLSSGKYTFKVKASNEDGIWSTSYAVEQIIIKPPFWLTYFAFFIYFITLITLIYLVVTITKVILRRKQQKIAEKQYQQQTLEFNQAKLQFFTNISHEIRTPLTLIACSVEKMKNNPGLIEKQENAMASITKNVDRILNLSNELLETRKIETGNYQLHVRREDIMTLLNGLLIAFKPLAEKVGIEISMCSFSDQIFIWHDQNALERVFCNLISNAIKYNRGEGKIDISVEMSSDNQLLEIRVTDTGVGIDKSKINGIFEMFHNFGGSKDSYEKGFGIGLFYTKELIGLHKGKVSVTSEVGVGSCFLIELLMNENVYSDDEKTDGVVKGVDLSLIEGNLKRQIINYQTPENRDATDELEITHDITILVIDDNEEILEAICEYLSPIYNTIIATNGAIGLEMAILNQPDIILSDVLMPVMDGISLCNELKNNINTSHIPLILLTAKSDSDTQIKGMELGADYFIPKPFNLKFLELTIRNIIKSRETIRNKFLSNTHLAINEFHGNTKDQEIAKMLFKYINDNISDPDLNITIIANNLGMSRSSFFRKIKSITGGSGKELIDSIRLKKAAQLLIESDMNISEIAYDIGHTNPLYFSKWFKIHYKMSPTEYIRQNKHKKSNLSE